MAAIAGIVGLLLCALVPLLPVRQTTATVLWPQGTTDGHVTQITAPLVSGAPRALDISIPCAAIATLPPSGGLVVSTLPTGGMDAGKNGLFVRADKDLVVVAFRDTVAAVAPRPAVAGGACSVLHAWADAGAAGAEFVGMPGASGMLPSEKKPQVGGIFTDLKVPAQPGLSARVDIDTRFITAPTALKQLAMVVGALAVLTAVMALAALDRRSRGGGTLVNWRSPIAWLSRYRPRARWSSWRRVGVATWIADAGVIATLLLWHVIGATSSDDGYNLTIARVAPKAGYIANYYRYFGDDGRAVRLVPRGAVQAGVGQHRRRVDAVTGHAGRDRLLAGDQPLDPAQAGAGQGRPGGEPGGGVHRGCGVPGRLVAVQQRPAARAADRARRADHLDAGRTRDRAATAGPGRGRHLRRDAHRDAGAAGLDRRRRAADRIAGHRPDDPAAPGDRRAAWRQLAVLAASLSLILLVVFRSQTLATIAESARIKYKVGPTIAWYQDWLRYYFLTVESNPDGSMARRFAVLVLLLCMFGMLVILLRRGRVPGVASGPAWRLIGTTAIGLLLLTFTPTKWAIQFGAFAGLAGALGAVTAFALARIGLHNRRNLTLYVTALLFVLAVATSGINGWFYVGNYGVPWYDIQPVVASHPVTSMFLTLSIITGLLAAWQHFRMDYAGHTEVKDNRRNRVLASTPLLVVATIMVVGEVASLTKGAVFRYPLYTTGKANLAAITSGLSPMSCAMADDVLTEPDPNAGMLQPAPGQTFGPDGPLGGINPVGFKPDGVGNDLRSYPVVTKPGVVNSDASPNKPNAAMSDSAGTAGGKGPVGVNGSHAALPFGLDSARTPVMGSYGENSLAATATSAWYQLPERTPDRPIVVVSASGAIWSYKEDGTFTYGQSLKLQWGVARPDGTTQPLTEVQPIDIGPEPAWRNLRFPLTWAPPEANVARIVAYDPNLSSDEWFAFTPPRVPVLQTLQQLMGSQTPVLMDIATAANFPCQRPFSEHLGVAELPQYRILPDHKQTAASSNGWQASEAGGPFLFAQAMLRTSTISTYLRGDWYRDWGSVEQYFPLVPADQAPDAVIEQGVMTVHGWSRQGPIRALP